METTGGGYAYVGHCLCDKLKAEIWHPRQVNGDKQPYHGMKARRTGFPSMLKFSGGKLMDIVPSGGKGE